MLSKEIRFCEKKYLDSGSYLSLLLVYVCFARESVSAVLCAFMSF